MPSIISDKKYIHEFRFLFKLFSCPSHLNEHKQKDVLRVIDLTYTLKFIWVSPYC